MFGVCSYRREEGEEGASGSVAPRGEQSGARRMPCDAGARDTGGRHAAYSGGKHGYCCKQMIMETRQERE